MKILHISGQIWHATESCQQHWQIWMTKKKNTINQASALWKLNHFFCSQILWVCPLNALKPRPWLNCQSNTLTSVFFIFLLLEQKYTLLSLRWLEICPINSSRGKEMITFVEWLKRNCTKYLIATVKRCYVKLWYNFYIPRPTCLPLPSPLRQIHTFQSLNTHVSCFAHKAASVWYHCSPMNNGAGAQLRNEQSTVYIG